MKKKIVAAVALSIALLAGPAFAEERHDREMRHHDHHYDTHYDYGHHHNLVRHIINHL
jgi:hypothetical protein